MFSRVYLAGPVRTPIGKLNGALSPFSAADLGAAAAREAIRRGGISPEHVDLTIMGNARQAGNGPNIARQIAMRAGVPEEKPAYTINMACASGLQAVLCAVGEVALGNADVVLAGGTESMTSVPYLLPRMRQGYRLGDAEVVDANFRDGFLCPLCGQLMGKTAENLAERYHLSRTEQDEYAVLSQARFEKARSRGVLQDEIVPLRIPGNGKPIAEDEHPRFGVTVESLSKLSPVFKKEGTVHAGNSSGVTDGAAALLVLGEEKLKTLGVAPAARVTGHQASGVSPAFMGIGPVPSVRALLEKTRKKLEEVELVELNEAFAAQVLACERELGLDRERLNVNGGAIALGHPIGCSGARIVVTLLHEMARRKAKTGLATLCVSGGLGVSLLVERP